MIEATIAKYVTPLAPLPTMLSPQGRLTAKIKCILFDIYGTLFISGSGDIGGAKKKSYKYQKVDELLAKFDINSTSSLLLAEFYRCVEKKHAQLRHQGVDFPEVAIDQIWMQILEKDDPEMVRQFALEFELIVNPVYPMPHLNEILTACRERQLLMGIVSNAQFYTLYLFEWFLNADCEHLGFNRDLILLSYQFGYAKPSFFLFHAAAERLKDKGINPHAVLFVGNDMLNDIYPAKMAGYQTALFAGDDRSLRLRMEDPRCQNLSADIVITDLIQLIDHVA
ncbi:MAG: HAD family hydrolase [Desulfobacterales bacterium]|nr:MAG: HAD family hydrolase [Desulfobacterales bacterium]